MTVRLHTSLEAAKAVMTPVDARVFDPTYSNGLGSLQEDFGKGLRCPVRGCGKWYHALALHLRKHGLGAAAFRSALSLSPTTPLISTKVRECMSAASVGRLTIPQPTTAARVQGLATRAATVASIGSYNLKGRCPAQLEHRLKQLTTTMGHEPTFAEATKAWGSGLVSWIVRHYGTWNTFKQSAGQHSRECGGQVRVTLDAVLDVLARYVKMTGDLPTYDGAAQANATAPETVLRVFGETHWPIAMQRAARLLNLSHSRYLPQEKLTRRCTACSQVTTRDPCSICRTWWSRSAVA